MGWFTYGTGDRFDFDDRALTHLRTVIFGKFHLQESVVFTWVADGRQNSLWLHPTVPLRFEFDEEVTPELNPAWVEQLVSLANSPTGLRLTEEPPQPASTQ